MTTAQPAIIVELASRVLFFLSALASLLVMASALPSVEISKVYALQFGSAVASSILIAPLGLWINKRILSWPNNKVLFGAVLYRYCIPIILLVIAAALFLGFTLKLFGLDANPDAWCMVIVGAILLIAQGVGMMYLGVLNLKQLRGGYSTGLLLMSCLQVTLPIVATEIWSQTWQAWILGMAAAYSSVAVYGIATLLGQPNLKELKKSSATGPQKQDPSLELVSLIFIVPLITFISNYYKIAGFSEDPFIASILMSYSIALLFGAASEQLAAQKYGPLIYAEFSKKTVNRKRVGYLHRAQMKIMYYSLLLLALNILILKDAFYRITGVSVSVKVIAMGIIIEALRFTVARIQLLYQLSGRSSQFGRTVAICVCATLVLEALFANTTDPYVPIIPMLFALLLVCTTAWMGTDRDFFLAKKRDSIYLLVLASSICLNLIWSLYSPLGNLALYYFSLCLSVPASWLLLQTLVDERLHESP